jgi:anti-sigma factor RsiW
MNCSRAQHLLQLYIDGQLNLRQTRALERHLLRCTACRAEWILLEDVVAGVHSLNYVVEPAWLTQSIMERVAETTAQPPAELVIEPPRPRQRVLQRTPFRLTLQDLILSSLLATIVVIGFAIIQPGLRDTLAKSMNPLMGSILSDLQFLISPNAGILGLVAWLLWVGLGISITLVLAGSEVRSQWRQRIRDWLPQGWR